MVFQSIYAKREKIAKAKQIRQIVMSKTTRTCDPRRNKSSLIPLGQQFDKFSKIVYLTLLGLGLIKIITVSANFNNPRPLLILNNLQVDMRYI